MALIQYAILNVSPKDIPQIYEGGTVHFECSYRRIIADIIEIYDDSILIKFWNKIEHQFVVDELHIPIKNIKFNE